MIRGGVRAATCWARRDILLTRQLHKQAPSVLQVHPTVREALDDGKPVVALESTVITHGMQYPHNLSTAREVEAIVREAGAVPATTAILSGRLCVGLTDEQLEMLAKEGPKAVKCSTRDIPLALRKGWVGATTVASTVRIANLAGIRVFVTGGIGGVHREAERTMDVSADLVELGRNPVVVVCAGVKSILDIPKTLEVLETQGVPVLCYGTDRFPAFFSPDSGLPAPARVDSPAEAAACLQSSLAAGMDGGVLLAVPNPSPAKNVQGAIDSAVSEASRKGLRGKSVTPFILKRVAEETKGESLRANIALLKHNAKIGAAIAICISKGDSFGAPVSGKS